MLYSIIDVETTGYPKNKITDISIFTTDGEKIINEFHTLINPRTSIPYNITRLTGISDATVKDAPFFHQVAKQIIDTTRNAIFVAHNVNFDFNVIKNEFKELGYFYRRKKLCTVKLARKHIPGHKSYSLGKICKDLNIKIENRHRAKGDAFATYKLFKLIIKTKNSSFFDEIIYNKQLTVSNFINEKELDKLPNKIGVYYFWNEQKEIIYIGKSINIKDRVLSHFRDDKKKEIKMCQQVKNITYELTGSDLIAQLKESDEIKKHNPIFNIRQRRLGETYALTYFTNKNGIIELKINYLKSSTNVIHTYEGLKKGKDHLQNIIEKNQLCPIFCQLEKSQNGCFNFQIKKCSGICCGNETKEKYNKKVLKFIASSKPKKLLKTIFTKGRSNNEQGFVFINKGAYLGYGFIPKKEDDLNNLTLEKYLISNKDNRDARRIINSFLKRNNTNE
ncbi:MAG: DNA polymerase III subunit epsilon [Crocinitomicaceae bacterium]|nr:DNA polymerase III subunit epsilon [Crocinitomicaceae bacterium]|tara:strand:+ start:8582 stop:9925 length:1344 start_codon:yes stop_codon:yes gene_type:complete